MTEQLDRLRAERGYLLSYALVFAAFDPDWLDAWAAFYRDSVLRLRRLDKRRRELVWIAILATKEEAIGSIHLERARSAGASPDQIREAIAIAAVTGAYETIDFAAQNWLDSTDASDLLNAVAPPATALDPELSELCSLVACVVRRDSQGVRRSLARLQASDPRDIAEALSLAIPPAGLNAVVAACDEWLDLTREGSGPGVAQLAELLDQYPVRRQ